MKQVIIILTFLYSLSFAEPGDKREYRVDRITGVNAVTDSINLNPEEALELSNFVLDKFGAVHKRYGVDPWNDSLISVDSIKDIHYVEDTNGDKTMFIATNNYIYELPGWEDTITSITWAGYEIDYEVGRVDATNETQYIYGDTNTYDYMTWIPVVDIGDIIIVGTDTLTIDSILTDTSLHVTTNSSAHSNASYRILKTVKGIPRLSANRGNLFVADSRGQPWWYDGVKPQLLGIIDEGNVTTSIIADTTLVAYDSGTVRLEKKSNIVRIRGADISDTAFTAGNVFNASGRWDDFIHKLSATIKNTAILGGTDTVIYFERAVNWARPSGTGDPEVPDVVFLPDTTNAGRNIGRWWINHKNIRLTVEQYEHIEDSTQVWGADDYQGFWIINSKNAFDRGYITGNSEDAISFNAANTIRGAMKITPSSANDNYTYSDSLCFYEGPLFCQEAPTTWTSPGSGTDIEMVCDSMTKYLNEDPNLEFMNLIITDSTTFYYITGREGLPFTVDADTAQDTTTTDIALGIAFIPNDKYYVAWQTPSMADKIINFDWYQYNLDSAFVNEIFFSQIYFHRNRLWAIGKEIIRYNVEYDRWNTYTAGDTSSTGRVWFSDLGRPGYIPSDYNFDITGANLSDANLSLYSSDATQSLFGLRNDLYVTTNSNIYRISGEPAQVPEELYLSQVIQGIGTNQSNGIVTTKDNVAYVMNQQGVWLFDGNTIQKISYKIDPLVERYRNSRMVAGKFKDNLFFSYPDSSITIVMHDPTKGFTTWDIGMLVINDQSVAIDSNYFLFSRVEDSAYVMKYPKSLVGYTDVFVPGATSNQIAISYRSGWQSLGPIDFARVIEQAAFQITKGPEDVHTLIYGDFDLTDTLHIDTSGSSGHHIVRFRMSNDDAKDYYQFHVKNATSSDLTLSGYYIKCRDSHRK